MKIIVRTAGGRDISHLQKEIPGLIVVHNETSGMAAFNEALVTAGGHSAVHMEDDVILCPDFYKRLTEYTTVYANDVIQFFSMRKDDLTIGTRYIDGRRFMMNQCFYLPEGMSNDLMHFARTWKRYGEHPNGYDILMADYFGTKKIKYLNVVPNLVDHMVCKSLINPRRSSKRQSYTFKYWEDTEE